MLLRLKSQCFPEGLLLPCCNSTTAGLDSQEYFLNDFQLQVFEAAPLPPPKPARSLAWNVLLSRASHLSHGSSHTSSPYSLKIRHLFLLTKGYVHRLFFFFFFLLHVYVAGVHMCMDTHRGVMCV